MHKLIQREYLGTDAFIQLARGLGLVEAVGDRRSKILDCDRLKPCMGRGQRNHRQDLLHTAEQIHELILGAKDDRGPQNRQLQGLVGPEGRLTGSL